MIGIRNDIKRNFFDRAKVRNAMARATRRALSKFGAFVRRRARSSIRKRKAVSAPGSPPTNRLGLLRDHIFFAAEGSANVVIGPVLLNGRSSDKVLSALEHGGPSIIMSRGKPKNVMIRARPFMKPAFDEELEKAPKLWENAMR